MTTTTKQYSPATRKRCVGAAWRNGRHVRILHPAFGYGNKIGIIDDVGSVLVYVRIKLGKKPGQCDVIAYLPEQLRLI